MKTIVEGSLAFDFPDSWTVGKYDQWTFYLKHFQTVCGSAKGVDVVALVPDGTAWLVEIKDYRAGPRQKLLDLADEVALKVRDTLAGLAAARVRATNDDEKELAVRILQGTGPKVMLHLEQGAKPTRLHPIEDPSRVLQKLKQLLRAIDYHPRVTNLATAGQYGWRVREM